MFNQQPAITKRVVDLLGWPTDVVSIDHLTQQSDVHTYILFVPGNPGLVGWYIPPLVQILQQLGPGFAGRGISYAGHGVTKDIVTVEDYEYPNESSSSSSSTRRNVQIPWTVNGQVEHKIAWLESMKEELKGKKLIFLSHSIGAHLIQRLLVLCQDSWRLRTSAIIHWMPFIRMDAPWQEKIKLDTAARYPDFVIHWSRQLLSNVSRSMKESALADKVLDKEGLDLAVNLVSHPTFVRNFFELGTEEIRDLPQLPDMAALRLLSSPSGRMIAIPIFILYCPNDHWCPEEHASDIISQQNNWNVTFEFAEKLKHDFVVNPSMIPTAVDFVVRSVRRTYAAVPGTLRSKL